MYDPNPTIPRPQDLVTLFHKICNEEDTKEDWMKISETIQWVKERADATPKHGTATTSTGRATELVEAVFEKQYPAMASMLGPRRAATVEQIIKEA